MCTKHTAQYRLHVRQQPHDQGLHSHSPQHTPIDVPSNSHGDAVTAHVYLLHHRGLQTRERRVTDVCVAIGQSRDVLKEQRPAPLDIVLQ